MNNSTILIVDDVDINREILCEIFEDYKTIQAANGKEALDIIAAKPDEISVVLLDVVMPVMNGVEVLEEMKQHFLQEICSVCIAAMQNVIVGKQKL